MVSPEEYTQRLERTDANWWKRMLDVQAPYRRNIRRVVPTPVLDVGCGIGRNLIHLDGRGVGVDTNAHSVEAARRRGLVAHTADDFPSTDDAVAGNYRALLFAHVLEHMDLETATRLVGDYLPYLGPDGLVVVIVPQEAGFASDPTHVAFVGPGEIKRVALANNLDIESVYSFPFPRWVGRLFRHNETVALLRNPSTDQATSDWEPAGGNP